jgi:hypothetical protein
LVNKGRAIAQTFSHRLPIAAARVRIRVKLCGICGTKISTGVEVQVRYWSTRAMPQLRPLVTGFPLRRAGVRAGVKSCGICGRQSSTGVEVQVHYWSTRIMQQLRRLVGGLPSRRPRIEPESGHVEFVVDKVALGQFISEYFGFPC